ncbi:fused signal recognition particle receptor [Psychrobacter luti]|uniref:Signal recognition particle receptor FtsY n=1 Tax=Psychrobacter luti TaxID=198481 RepID=A0A839TA55_9GAMM|nr:signal recognition particle-docking protein FtsY [Psychrobacter luti]MBB3105998.1 fused signal recognition particle receptor [Psychrobacter luti]
MNNPNNSNRVVINLDGGLDDLDDDDITLPSLPAQTVPIVEMEKQSPSENTLESTLESTVESTAASALNTSKAIPSQSTTTVPTMPLQDHLGDRPSVTPTNSDTSAINKAQTESKAKTELQQPTAAPEESQETEENKKKGSWFNRMKTGLSKSRKNLAEGMVSILIGGKEIDDELLEEVEDQLLVADIGVNATNRIIKSLTEQTARGDLIYAHSLYKALQTELVDILTPKVAPLVIDTTKKPFVILVVGVNGVGKTTTIGKLAKRLQGEGKSVMLAAGDTFRAAATEQLQIWGERNNIPVVAQGHGSDSASVIFDAMQSAKAKNIDVLIADTAGRLQNKTHLMAELEKVVRVMRKADPSAPHEGMIVLDAGTGQNAINQVELFNKVVPLTGITITKLDGTAKGGVVFNIAETTEVPIRYIGVGESIDDLRAFSPKQFVAALFETDDKE